MSFRDIHQQLRQIELQLIAMENQTIEERKGIRGWANQMNGLRMRYKQLQSIMMGYGKKYRIMKIIALFAHKKDSPLKCMEIYYTGITQEDALDYAIYRLQCNDYHFIKEIKVHELKVGEPNFLVV